MIRLCVICVICGQCFAQSLGIYQWAGQVNSLSLPALHEFGVDTARIFVGAKYDYRHPERSPKRFRGRSLTAILARYRPLLDDPKIKTVWLTAYPVIRGDEIDLRREVSEADWVEEGKQMRDMVAWLRRNYPRKVILISNHEADEKLKEAPAANVIRDYQLRYEAVRSARGTARIFWGVEISKWKLDAGTNALATVLPKLQYDFVSFSAWEAVVPGNIREALDDIASRTRPSDEGRAFFGDRHVLIGEFGLAREWKLETSKLQPFLDALAENRTRYAIYWQLYDNTSGDVRGFGLLDPKGRFTCTGLQFLKRKPPSSRVACR